MVTSASPAASHFDVLVLGPFSLFRDGTPLDTTGWQRKVHSLFRLLVVAPDRRRSRDELVDILWPDAAPEAGARNLRVVLHMLRRGLGGGEPSPALSEWGWIALNPAHEWDIDLVHFEELACHAGDDVAALEEAAGFYRGEPFPEDRYEDWAITARDRIQRTWRELCLRLARLHQEAGADAAALSWVERVLESDPLDEEATVALLVALGNLGRRTEALRRYAQFAQRLGDEMDLTPSCEVLDVVARLKSERERSELSAVHLEHGPVAARPVPVIPRCTLPVAGRLVGRERELGRILWTLPPLHVVAPRLAVVAGGTGVGKSRLLGEVAVRARKAGLLTLAGAAYEQEGRLLYGPIRDALADYLEAQPEALIRAQLGELLGDLARIVPELRYRLSGIPEAATGVEDPRLSLFLSVTRALEHISRDTPLVLLLDDLQWADEPTLHLLHFIVRRTSENKMLVVAAYRNDAEPGAMTRLADTLESEGMATYIPLAPLMPADLAHILEDRLRGRCAESLTSLVHEWSGGNPLHAVRMLRLLQERELLEHSAAGWEAAPGATVD